MEKHGANIDIRKMLLTLLILFLVHHTARVESTLSSDHDNSKLSFSLALTAKGECKTYYASSLMQIKYRPEKQ